MKKKLIPAVVIVIVLLAIIGLAGWIYIKGTPQYSVYSMYKAVDQKDLTTFKKYFDVDGVTNKVVDQAIDEAAKEQEKSGDADEMFGKGFIEIFAANLKPEFKEKFKSELEKSVESSDFKKEHKPKSLLAAYKEMKVKKDGKIAQVTLDDKKGDAWSFKMRQKDGYWQVSDIDLADIGDKTLTK